MVEHITLGLLGNLQKKMVFTDNVIFQKLLFIRVLLGDNCLQLMVSMTCIFSFGLEPLSLSHALFLYIFIKYLIHYVTKSDI